MSKLRYFFSYICFLKGHNEKYVFLSTLILNQIEAMKRTLMLMFCIIMLMLFPLFHASVYSSSPPPPPPGHGQSGNVPGGGGSLEGGLLIMLSLAIGYSAKKAYESWKLKAEEN